MQEKILKKKFSFQNIANRWQYRRMFRISWASIMENNKEIGIVNNIRRKSSIKKESIKIRNLHVLKYGVLLG